MSWRFPLAAGLAALVTFGLFWVMQALISVPYQLGEAGQRTSVDFVRLRRDDAPEVKKREPPRREKPDQPPPPPEMNMAQNIKPGDVVGEVIPIVDTGVELEKATSLGAGGSDRDAVPLVRVDAEYPPRARQQGIEGWVELEFTITPVGTVDDVKVLAAQPPYIFDRAAVNAVRRYRYNPKIENGAAVARRGQTIRLRFELPKGGR